MTVALVRCALILLSLYQCTVRAELLLVYSIQRHGARNVLPKSAVLTESDAAGGPTLLPAGKAGCYQAGTAFNQRYIHTTTCSSRTPSTCLSSPGREQYGVINKPGIGFSNYNTYANSSGLDRTIISANSFLAGVFPDTTGGANSNMSLQTLPVYSVSDSEDWKIRGYSKCPAYQQRLTAWLSSDAFKQKEQETQALRQRVQQLAPQLNTSLAVWWDVFDSFNVWRTYGVGNPMPDMDDDTFNQVVDLAMWLETAKMSPELTGNLLGGGLLGDMLARMAAAEQAAATGSQAPYFKLLTVSSHYNTQLGLLSALQAGVDPSRRTAYTWLSKIPALSAVLVFELHKTPDNELVVRAVVQDGPKAQYQLLPLPCAVPGDAAEVFSGAGSCMLGRFRALAGPQAMNSSGDWCEACSNKQVLACVVRRMERQLAAMGVDPASAGVGDVVGRQRNRQVWSPAVIGLLCVAVVAAAALLAGGVFVVVRHRRRSKQQQQQLHFLRGSGQAGPDQPLPLGRSAPV